MDAVKIALDGRGMTMEAARQCATDRKEFGALVLMQMIEFNAGIFASPRVLSDHPPTLWWIFIWRGV